MLGGTFISDADGVNQSCSGVYTITVDSIPPGVGPIGGTG
jgi:hypothetical protein